MNYKDFNAKVIDSWCERGWEWGVSIDHETYIKAQNGDWNVYLTPTKYVPHSWFGNLKSQKLLGLAAGGGQQLPIFSALGAKCTLLDISLNQCASDRMVARREGYEIDIIQGDMTEPLPFADESFDIIFFPVANCYIKDIAPVFKECYRVLKKDGRLLGGYDLELNYVFDDANEKITYRLPFDPLNCQEHLDDSLKYDWGIAFSHTVAEQIGSQIRAGFKIADIYDDVAQNGILHEYNINSFIAVLAIKE